MVSFMAKISCMCSNTLRWLQIIPWVIRFRGKVVPEVARVVLRNKKRRTAALQFPLLHYQRLSNAQVLFPRFRNRLWPALPVSEEPARTAGATNTMLQHQSHSRSHSVCSLGFGTPPLRLFFIPWVNSFFLSTATFRLWIFSSICVHGLYFAVSVGPVDTPTPNSSEGELYWCIWLWCKGQVSHEGARGQRGTREGMWIWRVKILLKHSKTT